MKMRKAIRNSIQISLGITAEVLYTLIIMLAAFCICLVLTKKI